MTIKEYLLKKKAYERADEEVEDYKNKWNMCAIELGRDSADRLYAFEWGLSAGRCAYCKIELINAKRSLNALQRKILYLHDTYGFFKSLGD